MSTPGAAVKQRAGARNKLVRAFLEAREELVGTLFFLLGNREDAQAAVQEAFLKCWRGRRQAARIRNCRAWVFRVALNAAKDLQRNAWRRRVRPLAAAPAPDDLPSDHPADALIRSEETAQLHHALLG